MAELSDKQYMTQSEYAAYRGVTTGYISHLRKKESLVFTSSGLVDVKATDALLANTLDPLQGGNRHSQHVRTDVPDKLSYMDAKTREANARAVKAEMEAELMARGLVRVDEVEAQAFACARGARDALMAIPDRLAPLIAAETDAARVHALMTAEFILVCQQIAKSDFVGAPPPAA